MKWRNYKKKIKKLVGENNCKFRKHNGDYYQAIRISEKLSFLTNEWMLLIFNQNKGSTK